MESTTVMAEVADNDHNSSTHSTATAVLARDLDLATVVKINIGSSDSCSSSSKTKTPNFPIGYTDPYSSESCESCELLRMGGDDVGLPQNTEEWADCEVEFHGEFLHSNRRHSDFGDDDSEGEYRDDSEEGDGRHLTKVWANCFELGTPGKVAIIHYKVEFTPDICLADRKWVWRRLSQRFPQEHEFDGEILHNLGPVSDEALANVTKARVQIASGQIVQTKLELMKMDDSMKKALTTTFYDSLAERLFQKLNYKKIGQEYFDFDRTKLVTVGDWKLTIAPGFRMALREHNGKILLVINSAYQVLQTDCVLEMIMKMKTEVKGSGGTKAHFKELLDAELLGSTVLTPHNLMSYKVDDIYWHENPASKMKTKNGEKSYMDYHFDRYGQTTTTTNQPLLISHNENFWGPASGSSNSNGQEEKREPARLIPELCNLLDLTPTMRKDTARVKELKTLLAGMSTPDKTATEIMKFANRMRATPDCKQILVKWGLEIKPSVMEFTAQKLPEEVLSVTNLDDKNKRRRYQATDMYKILSAGTQSLKSYIATLPLPVSLIRWTCIAPITSLEPLDKFIRMMITKADQLGIPLRNPFDIDYFIEGVEEIINYKKYVDFIEQRVSEAMDKGPLQIVLIVLPDNNPVLYKTIKAMMCKSLGCLSQFVLADTLTQRKNQLQRNAGRLLLQMNTKLAGIPWRVEGMPANFDDEFLVIGYAQLVEPEKGITFGAMVAFSGNLNFGTYSTVFTFNKDVKTSEGIDIKGNVPKMEESFIKCITEWAKKVAGARKVPTNIIFYRYVGKCSEYPAEEPTGIDEEFRTLKDCVDREHKKSMDTEKPKVACIVVREDTGIIIFQRAPSAKCRCSCGVEECEEYKGCKKRTEVVPPAFLIDNTLTRKDGSDFYLMTGTKTPIYYNIKSVSDDFEYHRELIPSLTHKLCYLNYNVNATVRMPAPCLYAVKLAKFSAKIYGVPNGEAAASDDVAEYMKESLYFL